MGEPTVSLPIRGEAHAGFPSPAQDYESGPPSLDARLIENPAATFLFRVETDECEALGVRRGDLALVDRSVAPYHGCLAAVCFDGEIQLAQLRFPRGGGPPMIVTDPKRALRRLRDGETLDLWGVVRSTIRVWK